MSKAIYLSHKKLLGFDLKITGGVQLCSQEFFNLLSRCGFQLTPFYVEYTKKIWSRFLIKLKFDCYSAYNVKKDSVKLISYIEENNIDYVFINHSTALRYSKPVREYFGNRIKIYLLSHGNDSGDFLHVTTKPIKKYNFYSKNRDLFRLGRILHTESVFRTNYLDGIITVSAVEEQIEKWLGAKNVLYTPRTINKSYHLTLKTDYRKVGFIGRLDHPPNYHGLILLCNEILKLKPDNNFEFALIGAPETMGKEFSEKYPFITYKGELSDNQLENEISTWAIFLNPVFWYSMGVTTKIAKAIEWGIPVITTQSGLRGYSWDNGSMLEAVSPEDMAKTIIKTINDTSKIDFCINEMQKIKGSTYSIDELASKLSGFFNLV